MFGGYCKTLTKVAWQQSVVVFGGYCKTLSKAAWQQSVVVFGGYCKTLPKAAWQQSVVVFGGYYKNLSHCSVDRHPESGRLHCTYCGDRELVSDLMFNQEGMPQTHQSVLEISGLLEFSGCKLVASSMIFKQPPIHSEENSVPIHLLMYCWVV